MAKIDSNYNIETNRGNILPLTIKQKLKDDGSIIKFKIGDMVRFTIMEKNNCNNVIVQKDIVVENESESITIIVPAEEMKIGEVISQPVEYWYEVELNPNSSEATTILGYTKENGAKILTLCPEGGDKK